MLPDHETEITNDAPNVTVTKTEKKEYVPPMSSNYQNSMNMSSLDNLLEAERQSYKNEPWNKLAKTQKTQLLHSFAETYGREKGIPMKEVKQLKLYFNECLDKGKLSKTKDVVYNRESRALESIPALYFNSEKRQFSLRNLDGKRVSTLKSLTPKRNTSLEQKKET